MRKQLKVLLLVATVLALFAMAMIVGSAEDNLFKNATTETEYADFYAAYDAATEGDTIVLLGNATVTAANKTLSKSITISGDDGNEGRYKLTIDASTENTLLFVTSANEKTLRFEDVLIDVKDNTSKYGLAGGGKNYEGNVVEFDNCVVNADEKGAIRSGRFIVNINDTTINSPDYFVCNNNGNNFVTEIYITGSSVININGGTTGLAYGYANVLVVGEEGADNSGIVINAPTTFFTVSDASKATAEEDQIGSLTIYGGTFNATATTAGAAGMIVVNVPDLANIYGGTFVSEAAALFSGAAAGNLTVANSTITAPLVAGNAGTITVTNCTVNGETVASIAAFDVASMFPAANILVVPAALIVNNEALIDYKLFTDTVVLAPAGVMMAADQANDTYVQTVTYASASYKMYVASAGNFENAAAAGASIRQDLNGLMFATEIAKEDVEAILAANSVTLADLRFYTLIAPMDYIAKANGAFTKDALDATDIAGVKYVAIQAQNSLLGITDGAWDQDATAVAYSGVLSQLQSQTRGYAAVAMIEFTVGETTTTLYGDFCTLDNVRSATQVAALAQ